MVQYNQGGIQINPANKGKFTNYANDKGMTVQQAAQWVMKNSKNPILRKRANFAINAANFKRQEGGMQESPEMEEREGMGEMEGMEGQIMQMVAQAIQGGMAPEEVMQMLVQQGIPQEQAMQIIQAVMSQMQGQMSQEQPMMRYGGIPMYGPGGSKKFIPMQNRYSSKDATYVKSPAGFEMDYSDKTNDYYKPIKPNLNIRENKRMYEDFMENRSKVPPFYYGKPLQYRGPYIKYAPMIKDYGDNNPNNEGGINYNNYKLGGYMNNMYRKEKLKSFYKKGGFTYEPNGYDVINEQMFNDIQRANGNAPMNPNDYQEQMSRKLAMEEYNEMVRKAQQNQKMAQKVLPKPVYDYLMKNKKNTPQVRQYIDPTYMMRNRL